MSERFFPDAMPQPMSDVATLPFWQAAAEHQLVVQRCSACGHTRIPGAPVCSKCRSESAEWTAVSGRGEIYTYTIVHRPVAPNMQLPFVIAVIALEDAGGVRIMSNVVGAKPEEIAIGARVEVVWEDMSAELAVPRFRLVGR
jgi:uncharacterized OB-fold protein